MTFKAVNGQAPSYVSDMLEPYRPVRTLRSADKGLLVTPTPELITKGGRAFSVRAPKLWNALPVDLRRASSVSSFKSLLKTHLYVKTFS